MLLFLFLFGVALGAESPSGDHQVKLQRGNCPMFWFSFNGRCYKYIAAHLTWADAELHCVSQGANLVSIHSLEEHNFINDLVKNFDHTMGKTWIGLTDLHKEGAWMWSDGCGVDLVLWTTGEPNNGSGGIENCGNTNSGTDLKWNDASCLTELPSVCASRTTCPQKPT